MAARVLFAVLFSGLVAFSGCVAGQAGQANSTPGVSSVAAPPEFSEDKGAIHGSVVDDQGLPIAGATVGLVEPSLTKTTAANGEFTFNQLPPAKYTFSVIALGYEAVSQRVEVKAGEVTQLHLVLVPVSIAEAYHKTLQQAGYVQCTLAMSPGVPTGGVYPGIPKWIGGVAVCGAFCIVQCLPAFPPDKFLLHWALDKGAQELVHEMSWTSTQAAGKGLFVVVEQDGVSNIPAKTYGQKIGPSPLIIFVNQTRMLNLSAATGQDCLTAKCKMQTRVFGAANTTNLVMPVDPPELGQLGKPDKHVDVGFVFDQKNTQYLTTFHNGLKPDGFTALGDK
jgi:hypothetical protein